MTEVIEVIEVGGAGKAAREFLGQPLQLLVNGAFVEGRGASIPVINPATGTAIAQCPIGTAQDIDEAVRAARHAFDKGDWKDLRPVARERLLLRLADLIERDADTLAELETLDNGKILPMARHGDLTLALDSLRYMAGWATKIEGTTISPSFAYVPHMRFTSQTLRRPVGVVGQIIPWNFPLVMAIWKIAPALAAGCTVVLKPSEETPLTALYLARLVVEAGFPAGAVNIVTGGAEAGIALVEHPLVDKIAFTGSTQVGQDIQRRAAATMKRLSLELGGKSPVVVLEDCDPDVAAQGAAGAIFFNHGQVCTAGSRLLVHRSLYEPVLKRLAAIADGMVLGDGFDPAAQMGPLISARQRDRVAGFVEGAKAQGARLVAGGFAPDREGFFFRPTIFADVAPTMTLACDEVFGPVLAVMPFDTEEEALALANDTSFGLGASVWTGDFTRAWRFAEGLKAGNVWVNAHNLLDPAVPFGGHRLSGYGRELGHAPLELYTEAKSVTLNLG
ncbi:aldehyde dehydrogenase family protein [Novosphingobium rosa]|uniref:aldehyde dehydrogenase family protein n=1 Tax=Novosphingobium rosa TaxID=76978 RepID=UPI00082E11D2|nr:aldehyde dehydrogenase family protein [Novosphingobium rosa]